MVVSVGRRLARRMNVVSPCGDIFIPRMPPAVHVLSRMVVLPVFFPVMSEQRDGDDMPLPA